MDTLHLLYTGLNRLVYTKQCTWIPCTYCTLSKHVLIYCIRVHGYLVPTLQSNKVLIYCTVEKLYFMCTIYNIDKK